jgi:hypothetical protein
MSANNKANNTTGQRSAKQSKQRKPRRMRNPQPSKKPKNKNTRLLGLPQLSRSEEVKIRKTLTQVVHKMLDPAQFPENPDFLIPRLTNARPITHRMVPWSKKLAITDFDESIGMAARFVPDPDQMLQLLEPPRAGNSAKDNYEQLQITKSFPNNGVLFFDHDLTLDRGSIIAVDAVVEGQSGFVWSENNKVLKAGTKAYLCGPFSPGSQWNFPFTNNTNFAIDLLAEVYTVTKSQDGTYAVNNASRAHVGPTAQTPGVSVLNELDAGDWFNFVAAANDPSCAGFIIRITLSSPEDTLGFNLSTSFINLQWDPLDKPIFGAAHNWVTYSLWSLLGVKGDTLKAEWDNSEQCAVTHLSANLHNFTANLNLTGSFAAAQLPRNHKTLLDNTPNAILQNIISLPSRNMKAPEDFREGAHLVWVWEELIDVEMISHDLRRTLETSSTATRHPSMIISVVCDGAISGTPSVTISGFINLEWITESITIPPSIPPNDVVLFMHCYTREIAQRQLFMKNGNHFKTLKKYATDIVTSPLFRRVVTEVGQIGLEAFLTLV